MEKIILIGAGGHCKSCIDVIEKEAKYEIAGLIDIKERVGDKVLGYDIIDCDENINKYINENTYFLIAIGQVKASAKRLEIYNKLKESGAKLAIVISPLAHVSKHAEISEGTIVMHHALINAGAHVGKNCIINSKALIEHDAKIGNHCHISTAAAVNGAVKIGDNSFVGSNAVIVNGIELPGESFIKAGSLSK